MFGMLGNGSFVHGLLGTAYNGIDYDSSAIDSVEYHPERQEAEITYVCGGKAYTFPMDDKEFTDFQNAPSKGQWVYYNARRYTNGRH